MAVSNGDRAHELNEVRWWSWWAEATWLSADVYMMFSKEFDEPFFNRAGLVGVPIDAESALESVENEFERRGRTPSIFVRQDQNHPRLLRAFDARGYRIADQMAVMELENPSFAVNREVQLEVGRRGDLDDWVTTYLTAFYGDLGQAEVVTRIVKGIPDGEGVSFMLARLDKRPVGCLALFKSEGLCGVYCLSTHPNFRGMRVASTMLELSHREAANEGRRLVLQTILSDSMEGFYLKLGFARLYAKDVFVRDARRSAR